MSTSEDRGQLRAARMPSEEVDAGDDGLVAVGEARLHQGAAWQHAASGIGQVAKPSSHSVCVHGVPEDFRSHAVVSLMQGALPSLSVCITCRGMCGRSAWPAGRGVRRGLRTNLGHQGKSRHMPCAASTRPRPLAARPPPAAPHCRHPAGPPAPAACRAAAHQAARLSRPPARRPARRAARPTARPRQSPSGPPPAAACGETGARPKTCAENWALGVARTRENGELTTCCGTLWSAW